MSENQELQEENSGANNNSKIIGSYLSLITKAESRYEGTLVEVDRVKKTMSLKNVKNMGTEGRRNGTNEQPPGDAILGMVKFRVDLIKTFEIIDKPVEEEEEEEIPDEENDPAIVVTMEDQGAKDKDTQEEKQKPQKKYEGGSRRHDDWSKGTNVKKTQQDGDSQGENSVYDDQKEPKQYQPQKEKVVGAMQPVNDKYQKKFDEAYDFGKHQMSKDEGKPEGEKKEGEEGKTEKPKYDKNADFFDNITNSTLEPSGDRGRGRGGRGFRGGYRGYQGGDDAFSRGGYRGRGNRGSYGDTRGGYGDSNREDKGEWWNNPNRGRGSYRGNRGRGNYQGYGDGTTGPQGDRKKLYSDTLRDPNDPNFHKRDDDDDTADPNAKGFFDNQRGGYENQRGGYENQRGGYRGRGERGQRGEYRGRGGGYRGRGGRPFTGEQAEKRDEETFGTFTSQNFKYNHEQNPSRGGRGGGGRGRGRGEGRGDAEVAKRPERNSKYNQDFYKGGDYKFPNEPVVEDGHKDFFDIKKKPKQDSRAKNRFAAMMTDKPSKKKKQQEDDDESEEDGSNTKEVEANAD